MTDTATRFVMEFYGIDEETAVRLYSDEIDAAQNLLKHEEFRDYMENNQYLIWAIRNKETLEPYEKDAIIQELNGILQREKQAILDSQYPDGDEYWK